MQKYSFLIFHKEYGDFLKDLQQLGALHVIEKEVDISDEIIEKQRLSQRIEKAIKILEKRQIVKSDNKSSDQNSLEISEDVLKKHNEVLALHQKIVSSNKDLLKIEPWGDFSAELIDKLKKVDYHIRFFITSRKKYDPKQFSDYHTEIINENGNSIYFILLQHGLQNSKLDIDAEEVKQPENSPVEIKSQIEEYRAEIAKIEKELDDFAKFSITALTETKDNIVSNLEYEKVVLNTTDEADQKMKIIEGWVPKTEKVAIDNYLDKNNILHIVEEAKKDDKVPILLKNNRFSKLFEPIGELFSLPAYSELDLTIFFAPFFMMFFGFCLGDAGYGLLFVIGAGLYKFKASKELKPMLSLIQLLGVATVIFGAISGTIFGVNLIDSNIDLVANYKDLFLNPDNMFNLALILGVVQIIFGLIIKSMNQIKQYGFMHALATFGWLIVLLGSIVYYGLIKLEFIAQNNIILYSILSLGGFLIIFFSDVEISIPARVGKGVWDIYSTVTGIFGDVLSYIRLFALGLSSAILGFVINDIAMQILGSSAILGPIFFVVFLIIGHTLNIMISSLGSFVHPMRLTFVEFYKNAGFQGGGKEYKPFSYKK